MQKVYHKPGWVTESALPLQPFSRTITLQTRLFIDVARKGGEMVDCPSAALTEKIADRDPATWNRRSNKIEASEEKYGSSGRES
jgi:hypothetical protein